jgi:hypothetical protein
MVKTVKDHVAAKTSAADASKPRDVSEIIPGNWGKAGSGWLARPFGNPAAKPGGRGRIHQFLWQRSRAVSHAKEELRGEER